MRYAEEVELLLEEMRRVLAFLEWDQDRWNKRALHARKKATGIADSPTPAPTVGLEEDLRAYALRQASVRQRLFSTFAQNWHDVPAFIALTDWGIADEE